MLSEEGIALLRSRTWSEFVDPWQGRILLVPDLDDPDQHAKDHGNLMDEGVAEVEREAADAVGGQDHTPADREAEPLPPADRSTGAAAFSESQKADEDSERKKSTEANQGSDEQAGELLAETDS